MDDSESVINEPVILTSSGKFRFIGSDAYAGMYRLPYVIVLILELCFTYAVYFTTFSSDWAVSTRALIITYVIIVSLHLLYVIFRQRNYLSPDLIYLLFYTLFNMGYFLVWVFGIVPDSELIFFEPSLYPKTILIVNVGLIAFLLGYELSGKSISQKPDYQIYGIPGIGWEIMGLLIMGSILVIELIYIFLIVGLDTFRLYGYEVYTNIEHFTSFNKLLWVQQSAIFPVGFAIYIISVAIRRKKLFFGKLGLALFMIQSALWAMEGARTALMTNILVLIFARHYLIKPFGLKALFIILFCSLFLFASIGIVRTITALDVGKMIEELGAAKEAGESHWYDPFVEMGGSIRTINMTVALVPKEFPYWYGRSYINTALHIVPFLQGWVAKINPRWSMNVSDWLTYTLHGPGASGLGWAVAGEGYINFGMPGVILHMMFYGFLLKRIYLWFILRISSARCFVFMITVGLFAVNVRNTTNTLFPQIVQIVILAWLMKELCGENEVIQEERSADNADSGSDSAYEISYVQ